MAESGAKLGKAAAELEVKEDLDVIAQLRDDLRQKGEEIRLLRGKLKGYATLGNLFQEAKNECLLYKNKNDELQKYLESYQQQSRRVQTSSGFPPSSAIYGAGPDTSESPNQTEASLNSEGHLAGRAVVEAACSEHSDGRADAFANVTTVPPAGTAPDTRPKKSQTRPGPTFIQQPSGGMASMGISEAGDIIAAPVNEEMSFSEVQEEDTEPLPAAGSVKEAKSGKHHGQDTTAQLTRAEAGSQDGCHQHMGRQLQMKQGQLNNENEESTSATPKSGHQSESELSSFVTDFSSVSTETDASTRSMIHSLSISTLPSGDSQDRSSESDAHWKTASKQQATRTTTINTEHEHLDSSPESEELSRQLVALRTSVERRFESYTASPLAVDITNLLHRAIKQDKQVHSAQVLLAGLTDENQKLRKNLKQAESRLAEAREYSTQLLKISQQRPDKDKIDDAPLPDNFIQSEWVQVEKQQNPQHAGDHVVMVTEVELLQRKGKQLQARVQELEQANEKLEEFCRHQHHDRERQVALLNARLVEQQRQDQQRQQEIDTMLLQGKKKTEVLEVQKTELADRLHEQHHRYLELQKHCENERQENHRLQQSVQALRLQLADQQDLLATLEAENRSISGHSMRGARLPDSQQMPSTVEGMKTQIMLLRQQITIYKDDFDNERRDREQSQSEKFALKEELQKLQSELITSRDENRKLRDDLRTARAEHDLTRKQLHKRAEDLTHLQQQFQQQQLQQQQQMWGVLPAAPPPVENYYCNLPARQGSSLPQRMPAVAPTDFRLQPPVPAVRQKWPCRHCTFLNIPERVTCEMCGQRASNVWYQDHMRQSSPVPITVEQFTAEGGCPQHLIARGRHGRIECDNQPSSSRQFSLSNDPSDLVVDAMMEKDEEQQKRSLP